MFLQGMGQTLFLVNVSLFMILTGYLNINKKVCRKYYIGGLRVIFSYLFISIITILFRRYYAHEDLSLVKWILKITDFSAIPYGWYIEMWIGLFLLTPFLNALWKGVANKRQKQILVITLYLLTALPDLLNRYGVHLAPGFWVSIYPLTFFFIGTYIREYQPRIIKWKLAIAILAICLINPVFNVLFMHGHTMIHIIGGESGVFGIPLATLFFLAFYQMDIHNAKIKKMLQQVSVLSLDMYLVSYIFDTLYYAWFNKHCFVNQSQFGIFIFVIVPLVFLSSFMFAWLKRHLFKTIHVPT
jgi:hypothetical protein